MTVIVEFKSTPAVSGAGKTCDTESVSTVMNSSLISSSGEVPSLATAEVVMSAVYSVAGVSLESGEKENVRASIHVSPPSAARAG